MRTPCFFASAWAASWRWLGGPGRQRPRSASSPSYGQRALPRRLPGRRPPTQLIRTCQLAAFGFGLKDFGRDVGKEVPRVVHDAVLDGPPDAAEPFDLLGVRIESF